MTSALSPSAGFSIQKAAEGREFLAARVGGADREAARGHAEILARGDRPVEARALENREFRLGAPSLVRGSTRNPEKPRSGSFSGTFSAAIIEFRSGRRRRAWRAPFSTM